MSQLVEKNLSAAACGTGWVGGGVLLGVGDEGDAVEHERPAAVVAHDHGGWGGGWFDAGAGGGVVRVQLR